MVLNTIMGIKKDRFDTDFEYDCWYEQQRHKELLDAYFGEDKKEVSEDDRIIG